MKNKKLQNQNNKLKQSYKLVNGFFGEYGGQFVPPQLEPYLKNLEKSYNELCLKDEFKEEFIYLLKQFVGRPSPLYYAKKLSKKLGYKIYLKREDLNHTGAHKINNTIGQVLLARYMGKTEVIAETGAGQHGVATATAAALMGMKCKIFMGAIDAKRQRMNVYRMKMLGAEVVEVQTGGKVLKDAVDGALGYLIENPDVFYLLGSVVGPHPYPKIVRDFQSIIGKETKRQILDLEGKLPDYLVACVGGGSNAIGLFADFLDDSRCDNVKIIGVEPAGKGINTKEHAATLTLGKPGVIHGFKCHLLQEEDGSPMEVYSIAAGLDYPGVGPEHSALKDSGRVKYEYVTDKETISAFYDLCRTEGIIPALESSHALAYLYKGKEDGVFKSDDLVVLNLSGRGDKDVEQLNEMAKD